ncbi:hypothetical protein GW17_00023984 [Ensete ventricosum]|nr:hypothetical protein GW17_00023984 [Ensete ventricosum]
MVLINLAGMNTGIQDAHNLAWKISSVLSGIASPSIIQTYEMERRPVKLLLFGFIAIYNTSLSVENFRAAMSVPAALGLDPAIANSGKNITAPCNLIWQLCS